MLKSTTFQLIVLLLLIIECCSFKLRVLKVKIADEKGAGMDGANIFKIGGQLKVQICSDQKVNSVYIRFLLESKTAINTAKLGQS